MSVDELVEILSDRVTALEVRIDMAEKRLRQLQAENERLRVEVAEAFNEGFEAGIRQREW